MDRERFFALGRELGLEKDALREWVDKECALAREERAREREEAKESAERQRLLQEQELKILELKLKLQESAVRQSTEANEPGGATSSVTTSTTLSRSVLSRKIENVPTVEGFMDKRPVTVLRDTGCDTVIVRQALVPKEKLTGAYRPVLFLDRTVRNLPEAVVFLDTPVFKGEVRAHCLRDSLYDVVLGNIKGALPLDTTRVMATRTPNRSSSADIEEKTPKTPRNRHSRRQDQVTVSHVVNRLRAPRPEPSDSSLSAANSDNHAACAKRWQATAPPSGSSQLSTSPWPNSRPDSTRYRGIRTPQDEALLPLDTTPRVPQRRRPRQHSYFEERNTGRLNQSRPGYPKLRSDGTDSLSAQMDQSPSSPQPPLQPPQDQVKTARQLDFHGVNRALCVLCLGACLFTRAGSVRAPRCDVYAAREPFPPCDFGATSINAASFDAYNFAPRPRVPSPSTNARPSYQSYDGYARRPPAVSQEWDGRAIHLSTDNISTSPQL
ncbi:hypothetical protein HPB52_008095 [Rhipicephalus sanguineus]|uniref:Uncharacterized protein n=1 Tax=Rhipicephalus sanguineus TaxID=34632 RepID=A0A9D4QIA8_RHISA|nr:hypothetical protein HPB52_008095 [Rhipicephalus sanguineus]